MFADANSVVSFLLYTRRIEILPRIRVAEQSTIQAGLVSFTGSNSQWSRHRIHITDPWFSVGMMLKVLIFLIVLKLFGYCALDK